MAKKIVKTEAAPAPIGPYNQAVWAGDLLFVSGQIAINPTTGELVTNTIEEEALQVMQNIQAILTEAGLTFNHIVKTSIFLENMDDFNRVNEVYGKYFEEGEAPARECVEVSQLPKDVSVEISVIAYK